MEHKYLDNQLTQIGPLLKGIDNRKRYKGVVQTLDGKSIRVYSTANTPASSYGFQHWVAADGTPYGQIDLANPLCPVRMIEEVTEEEAEKFERYHGMEE